MALLVAGVIDLNGRMLRLAPLALSIFSVFTASCVSASKQMNDMMASWVGRSQQDLTHEWGPPTYTTSDGGDGTILVYEQQRTRTSVGDFSPSFSPNPEPSQSHTQVVYVVKRMFYVNSKSVVYSWQWQGL